MDFVDACRHLIAIDTSPTQGNKRAAEWLARLASEMGLSVDLQPEMVREVENANIYIRPTGPRCDFEFMFEAHLDTADPGPFELWKRNRHNPFEATIVEGKLYGLGAADCKLDLLCKLEALKLFSKQKTSFQSLNPVVVGTFGEQEGMTGALRQIRKNKVAGKMAAIGEPSNLQLLVAGKGSARIEIRIPFESDESIFREEHNLRESTSTMSKSFHGKSAHSSTPHLGESAVSKMFDYLKSLPEDLVIMEIEGGVNFNSIPATAFLEIDPFSGFKMPMSKKLRHISRAIEKLESKFSQYKDLDFNPATPTFCVGAIRTRESFVDIEGIVGIPPRISNETYEAWIKEFGDLCQQVGADFRVNDYKRPYRTDAKSNLVRGSQDILNKMGRSKELGTHSSVNEASLFSRVGMECISFGPGEREGNIHTPDEHVKLEDLKVAVEFYRQLMERFCL